MTLEATLEEEAAQAAFDKALAGLRKQGCKARAASRFHVSSCTYLNEKGHKCGVGHILTDEELQLVKDHCLLQSPVAHLYGRDIETIEGLEITFLEDMQNHLHDSLSDDPETFSRELELAAVKFAEEHSLTVRAETPTEE